MQVVILCGGLGTRLSEETTVRPKPMVDIGGYPILWHIMKIYSAYGYDNFMLALGYKGEVIKDYFLNYHPRNTDMTLRVSTGVAEYADSDSEDWSVRMIDTGLSTMTGGRLHRLEPYLRDVGSFMLTYGDGVGSVDLRALMDFHRAHGKLATVTAVRPPARFGEIVFEGDRVIEFREKPQAGGGWINGGFFVFESGVFDYLEGDETILERDPLERLAADGQLMAYRHEGYWQCMDTLRDKNQLEEAWDSGSAPWKVWGGS